jgi:hypothetical protein
MKPEKKVRPYKRYFKQNDLAAIFGYASARAFYATSARDRILTAVDQIIREVESRTAIEKGKIKTNIKRIPKENE